MCHNFIRSIILKNMSQSHKIVTYQVETKFLKEKKYWNVNHLSSDKFKCSLFFFIYIKCILNFFLNNLLDVE